MCISSKQFLGVFSLLRNQISPIIQEALDSQGMNKSEISKLCHDEKYKSDKVKLNAMLLSYVYLFINEENAEVGAGDLATSSMTTGLSRPDKSNKPTPFYISTHTRLTNMYNDIFKGSLPISVLQFPHFFALPDKNYMQFFSSEKTFYEFRNDQRIIVAIHNLMLKLMNISLETFRNYHYLWYVYNQNKENVLSKSN